MIVRFIGQGGYVLKTAASEIMIDPYLSDSVNREEGRPRQHPIPIDPAGIQCDGVICTHNHLDHLDPDTVLQIPPQQRYITTAEGKVALGEMGRNNVTALQVGESTTAGDFKITAVYADHTTEAFGLIIQAEGRTLYFTADTLFSEKLFDAASFKPDVAFLCINGRLGNMNAEEAIIVAQKVGAKVNIPNHYDMFASNSADPLSFTEKVPNSLILAFDKEYTIEEILV